jgi:rare lipoprotein A
VELGILRLSICRVFFVMGLSGIVAACSTTEPKPAPISVPPKQAGVAPAPKPSVQEMGVASWYGPGFHGRPTSSGQIYDQEDLTAASTIFPLGCRVMVTNLENHRSVEVTINDRGPFVKGRKIDLSHKAAKIIGMLDNGTAPVRIDLISAPAGSRPVGSAPRYMVQIGSFSREDNADRLRDRMLPHFQDIRVDRLDADGHRYYRVRMGAFSTRAEAESRASATVNLGFPIIIVQE